MAIWSDIAQWRGPTVSKVAGGMYEYRGVVLHIAEGSYEGTISWQKNSTAEVSSHFVVAKDGRVAQMVDTADRAWTQSAGNGHWLSIEHEGFHGQALTPQQIEADARIYARAVREYGIPLQATDSTAGRGLGYHAMGGAGWGGHYDCPGNPIIAQRGQILARAQQILTPTPQEPEMELSDEFTSTRSGKTSLANAFATTLDDVHLDIKPAVARVESKVAELAGKIAQPAPVALTPEDRAAIVAALAPAVAEELAKRLGNG